MEHMTMPSIPGSSDSELVVWDPLVRVFHWSLVTSFTVAYLSGEGEMLDLHAWSGYIIGALILFRLLWGMVGPQHARFAISFLHRQRSWPTAVTCCMDRRNAISATTRWAAPWSSPCL
jgi:cytochrome b